MEGRIEDWIKAGRIAAEALAYGKSLIKPGARLLDVSDKVEARIFELGGKLAFPAQISCDHIAAHYCAEPNDTIIFDKQVVSLDVGVHVNGCIGDTALTVDLSGEHKDLIKASEEALKAAIALVRPGVTLNEIGKAVQEVIGSRGFSPVRNLSGHGLAPYQIHTKPSIPNFASGETYRLQEGQVIAIEPFATTGKGLIQEGGNATIFSVAAKRPSRNPFSRTLLDDLDVYEGLPFTTRWLYRKHPPVKVAFALRELVQTRSLVAYPPLVEVAHGLVSQAEHTVLVGEEPRVLTSVEE